MRLLDLGVGRLDTGAVHDIVVDHPEGVYTPSGLVDGRSALAGRFGYGASSSRPRPGSTSWDGSEGTSATWSGKDIVASEEDRVESAVGHESPPYQ